METNEELLRELASASKHARTSNGGAMELSLDNARNLASELGIDVSDSVAVIEEVGYNNATDLRLYFARLVANKGDARSMRGYLDDAVRYTERLEGDISEEVAQIEDAGYRTAVLVELKEARTAVTLRMTVPYRMEESLERAGEFAEKVDMDIDEEAAQIEREGYGICLPVALETARVRSDSGEMHSAKEFLRDAVRYAQIVGRDISGAVAEIEASLS